MALNTVSTMKCGRIGTSFLGVMLVISLAVPIGVSAKKLPSISGKLSKPGYTLIALADNGKARSVLVKKSSFKLRPPANSVTLQLRRPDGIYGGPIVVGTEKKGRVALVGVEAGAKLGQVKLKGGKGYAKLKKGLPEKWLDPKRTATAKEGIPIGAGKFGRVRVKNAKGPNGDRDLDGIPDRLDVDDDGDLILDNLDPSSSARESRSASASARQTPSNFVKSSLGEAIWQTRNANAPGFTETQAETTMVENGFIIVGINAGDSVELDCRGLTYCSTGGTGRVFRPGTLRSDMPRFPDGYDPDGDGLGNLIPSPSGPAFPAAFFLSHGATTAQIGTGDMLIERVTNDGVERELPTTIQYIFGTVPALVSYSDGQGNSAAIPYPVAGPTPGPAGPGALENPIPVAAGPNGDVVLTLTFWRPQRKPIPGETGYGSPGAWTDIGGLTYGASPGGPAMCPQSAFSEADPNLGPNPAGVQMTGGGFTDTSGDRPANPGNTLTYSLNFTQCLASAGMSFNEGEARTLVMNAFACGGSSCRYGESSGPDQAAQFITFRRK